MKITFVLLIFAFTFSSCTKNRERTVFISGTVVDFGSGEPILDAKIHVKDGFNGSGPFTESDFTTDAEAIVYTDNKGFFEVELTGRFNPYLYPSKSDEYWPYDAGDNAVTTSAEVYKRGSENIDEEIKLKSKAALDIIFKSKVDFKDSLRIKEYQYDTIIPTFINRNLFVKSYHLYTDVAIGNYQYKFKVQYKRNQKWNEFLDSVYIAKGETFQDTIYY